MRSLINLFKSQFNKSDGMYTYGVPKIEESRQAHQDRSKNAASHTLKLRIPKAYNKLIDSATDDDTIEVEYEIMVGSVTVHNVTLHS